MPRITRIHFASVGHHDARVPALTLDMRDPNGRPVDTVIWAENGTGKSSLLNLIFSTYRPNQRQFLGKQAEGKVRELTDYIRDRDLAFVITEWDISDGQRQGSLLGNVAPSLLLVGQMLSWRGLDRSNELRRLFFTMRPNHTLQLQSLPVLGLAHPVASFEAFRDWLDEQNRNLPGLEVRYTTNQTEWQEHLANHQLDPELFTYQLRMNEGEGGINNLFNSLKTDRDFIRLFLQLGFDPSSANQVRDNLQQFLPKLRNRAALELQLEFNERLLQELGLFVNQLALWQDIQTQATQAEHNSAALLAALRAAATKFASETKTHESECLRLKGEETRLSSQRAAVNRKQNYFKNLRYRLEEAEARIEFQSSQERCALAQQQKRVFEMAIALAQLAKLRVQADQLRMAIERERETAKPALEALEECGGRLRWKLNEELAFVFSAISKIEEQNARLRNEIAAYREAEVQLASERSEIKQQLGAIEQFFLARERHRERLRLEGRIESKETAAQALQTWNEVRASALEGCADAKNRRDTALRQKDEIAEQSEAVAHRVVTAEHEKSQSDHLVAAAETEEERIATHLQMRAATETMRADLNLPQTAERLMQRSELLFRRILRLNVEAAEDQRSGAYFDKHNLFPPHRDVETTVEKLSSAGIGSATTSLNWLAYNVADARKAAEILTRDPSTFTGVMFDHRSEAARAAEIVPGLSTEQIPVTVSPFPIVPDFDQDFHHDSSTNSNGSKSLTILPRHAGTFNFAAARTEASKLGAQIEIQAHELDTLKTDLAASRTLLDSLHAWIESYGGAKLRILRERARTAGQSFEEFKELQRDLFRRKEELQGVIRDSDAALANASQIKDRAETAIGQLEMFVNQYETPYESQATRQVELSNRLQTVEAEQLSSTEARKGKEEQEPAVRDRAIKLTVQQQALENELRKIRYATNMSEVTEPIDALRSSYEYQVKQFEGTFLNSAAQGQLSSAEQRIVEGEEQISREFNAVDRNAAVTLSTERDLDDGLQSANTALTSAHIEQGKAEEKLKTARTRSKEAGGLSELDKTIQVEMIPQTSQAAAEELAKLESQHTDLQAKLGLNRDELEHASSKRVIAEKRSLEFHNHAQRLSDLTLPETNEPLELPTEDARTTELVNETIYALQRLRKERDNQDAKLQDRYFAIQELTRDERYAKAIDLPARSLFAHMPCDELIGCAVLKTPALQEEIKTIRADLDLMAQHRETLVTSLLNVSKQAMRLLRRAERWSTMPSDMSGWESEPFLRIRLFEPQGEIECRSRLKWLVDSMLEEGRIPAGIELVFQAIVALVGETGIDATILKPETQRRKVRYPVREMAGWSEGERTTVAILLYCTLVKIRSQSRGIDAGQNQVSALLLDNPLGPCSKPEFLQMHRHIAGQLGVQLIYATGINDPPALSVFPNWVRLAKNRIVLETGELAIGLVGQHEDSLLMGLRIFEEQAKGGAA